MTDWVNFKPIIKSIESDPVCLFDLQVSPQFISEEDNETESENEILCTPKPKRLRKSNKRNSYECD